MPRGRNRRRTANQSSASRRTANTASRQRAIGSGAARRPTRTSLRIAERLSRSETGIATGRTMADVARRAQLVQGLGPRASETNPTRGRPHARSRRTRAASDGPQLPPRSPVTDAVTGYTLRMLVQPPARVGLNTFISPIVTATVYTWRRGSSVESGVDEAGMLWATASLLAVTLNRASVAVDARIMAGQVVASLSTVDNNRSGSECPGMGNFGSVSFPGLVILRCGTYRIRITLMRMDFSNDGVSAIQTVDTTPFTVE